MTEVATEASPVIAGRQALSAGGQPPEVESVEGQVLNPLPSVAAAAVPTLHANDGNIVSNVDYSNGDDRSWNRAPTNTSSSKQLPGAFTLDVHVPESESNQQNVCPDFAKSILHSWTRLLYHAAVRRLGQGRR